MIRKKKLNEWIRAHAITAGTHDPNAPLDDLKPLRELVGGARVVAIGESAHYVREFYLLRHRLLRFFVEQGGFTVYALEAPFTESHAIDAWVRGGPGTVQEAAAAVSFNQGQSREMYAHLSWMRERNRGDAAPVRFAGITLPGSGGSPLPALQAVGSYLRDHDPDALPLLEQAVQIAGSYHDTASFNALHRYAGLDPAVQNELSAVLSRLLARFETVADYQRSREARGMYTLALHHLRGAWYLDHFHRDLAGRGMRLEHPHTLHDAYMAESILRLLEDGPPDTRVVVAAHNIHIQKSPVQHAGTVDLFPTGYHLSRALGNDYVAIAATSLHGGTARMQMQPALPQGFEVNERPLPLPVEGCIEAAFDPEDLLTIVDLRTDGPEAGLAESFRRMRMEDYFMDVPVAEAFDAVALVAQTSCTEQAA
ncbi:MAG TPA: erythromycin esterase family protein [Chloroflexia bacterium]|nr:erythromycin esterase family protein [Chloroflexia bacterium]